MWSGAWNKAHFRNLLPNTQLPSSVGRTSEWWSGGYGFKPCWGQFLIKFILFCVDLSDNLTEMPIVKNPNESVTSLGIEALSYEKSWIRFDFTTIFLYLTFFCILYLLMQYPDSNAPQILNTDPLRPTKSKVKRFSYCSRRENSRVFPFLFDSFN